MSPLSDISTSWAAEDIKTATKLELVQGYDDGSFQPNKTTTRAEVATVIARVLGLDTSGKSRYADVANHWGSGAIAALQQVGLLNGFEDGSIQPKKEMTRAELVTLLVRTIDPSALPKDAIGFADTSKHWASNEIAEAKTLGIVEGSDGKFNPDETVTRAEMVSMVMRLLKLDPKIAEVLKE